MEVVFFNHFGVEGSFLNFVLIAMPQTKIRPHLIIFMQSKMFNNATLHIMDKLKIELQLNQKLIPHHAKSFEDLASNANSVRSAA